jgi:hypothetical protein
MIRTFMFLFLIMLRSVSGAEEELNCDAPEHRQLDYWIGEWNVIDQATGKQVGTSRIEKLLNGCIIFESWKGQDQFQGHSFNLYNREDGKWQQVWVDSRGQRIDFTGELRSDGIYYEGPFRSAGKKVLSRMKFLKLPGNRIRQLWEQSTDQGATWKVLFDGLYVRK